MDLQLLQLEMPLEALVLRPSATAAGSLWTWLAVLAAAFGLWRIRSVAVAVASKSDEPSRATAECDPVANKSQTQSPQPQPRPEGRALPASVPEVGDEGSCFTPKGTVFEAHGCYEEKDDVEDCGGDVVEERDEKPQETHRREERWGIGGGCLYGAGGGGVRWGELWRGDLGWYLYQDVAALNGRVVRLWEDEKRLVASQLARRHPQQMGW